VQENAETEKRSFSEGEEISYQDTLKGTGDDPDFISLEPAPKQNIGKRIDDPNKKNQMDALKRKREMQNADRNEYNFTAAIGKVKGECSDEDE
jgi:hypothetical protein